MNLQELKIKKPPELLAFAEEQGVEGAAMMRRQELMFAILQRVAAADQAIFGVGTIEVAPDGSGKPPPHRHADQEGRHDAAAAARHLDPRDRPYSADRQGPARPHRVA